MAKKEIASITQGPTFDISVGSSYAIGQAPDYKHIFGNIHDIRDTPNGYMVYAKTKDEQLFHLMTIKDSGVIIHYTHTGIMPRVGDFELDQWINVTIGDKEKRARIKSYDEDTKKYSVLIAGTESRMYFVEEYEIIGTKVNRI